MIRGDPRPLDGLRAIREKLVEYRDRVTSDPRDAAFVGDIIEDIDRLCNQMIERDVILDTAQLIATLGKIARLIIMIWGDGS